MMTPKYKAGDKVWVKSSLQEIYALPYDTVGFVPSMREYLGQEVTILSWLAGEDYVYYEIIEDGQEYWWDELYFDAAPEPESTYNVSTEELLSIINC